MKRIIKSNYSEYLNSDVVPPVREMEEDAVPYILDVVDYWDGVTCDEAARIACRNYLETYEDEHGIRFSRAQRNECLRVFQRVAQTKFTWNDDFDSTYADAYFD